MARKKEIAELEDSLATAINIKGGNDIPEAAAADISNEKQTASAGGSGLFGTRQRQTKHFNLSMTPDMWTRLEALKARTGHSVNGIILTALDSVLKEEGL